MEFLRVEIKKQKSIKPFIGRVKGRYARIDDTHLAHRSMSTARLDQDRRHRCDGHDFTVKFHPSAAFEHEVNLGQLLVIVKALVL